MIKKIAEVLYAKGLLIKYSLHSGFTVVLVSDRKDVLAASQFDWSEQQ
jgi:hypothetical protein